MTRSTTPTTRPSGSITQLPSGSLRVRVGYVCPITRTKKTMAKTVKPGPTARDQADAVLTDLLAKAALFKKGCSVPGETIAGLLDVFMKLRKVKVDSGDMSITSLVRDESLVAQYIKPRFGDTLVDDLTPTDLENWYLQLAECRRCWRKETGTKIDHNSSCKGICGKACKPHTCKPLAQASVRKIHNLLSAAFGRRERLTGQPNPCKRADRPSNSAPAPNAPGKNQLPLIIDAAFRLSHAWGVYVWLAAATGMRRGELCALTWDDFDLADNTLTVRKSLTQTNSRVSLKKPKSGRTRVVPIDGKTVDLLLGYRNTLRVDAKAKGLPRPALSKGDFVFTQNPESKEPMRPQCSSRKFTRMLKTISVQGYTLHSLRHFYASQLIGHGVNPRTVADLMGHASPQTTLVMYAQGTREAAVAAVGLVSDYLPDR